MPFIYKPIRQFMKPNESTIDPAIKNKFSLVIGGQICIAYRFQIYDMKNNLISDASTEIIPTKVFYNIVDINILRDILTIDSNNLVNGQEIRFFTDGTLPSPLSVDKVYYVGNLEYGRFNVYTTQEDALNDENKIDILNEGDGNHGVVIESPLYNGDTLEIILDEDRLTAGNTYKWQVELIANNLNVNSIDIENNTITIENHNLVTGDMIYIFGNELPSPLKKDTVYYVNKIDTNTIALFDNIEGARNDAGRIDITETKDGLYVSNIAISEQIVFLAYDSPIVTFESETITQQSYKFKPSYYHPQGVMISNFTVYISPQDNPEIIDSSGLQENIKLEYTFDGLLSGSVYNVKFVINTKVNQTYETNWIPFQVQYDTPNLGLNPNVKNDEMNSAVIMEWPGIKQIVGDPVGDMNFVDDFVVSGNTGLNIPSDSYLVFSGLEIKKGSVPPMFWWTPNSSDFTGTIMRCDNTSTGDYIEIGYNGVAFYRIIDGVQFVNAPTIIRPDFLYLIGMTQESLVVNVVGNINR